MVKYVNICQVQKSINMQKYDLGCCSRPRSASDRRGIPVSFKEFSRTAVFKKLLQTNTCAGRQFVKIVVISNIIKIMKLLRY